MLQRVIVGLVVLTVLYGLSYGQESKGRTTSSGVAEIDQQPMSNSNPSETLGDSKTHQGLDVPVEKHSGENSTCKKADGWKQFGNYAWCRTLDWITAERVIAIWTVILGIATWRLWIATDRLVKGADESAERQHKAYVSVEPTLVFNFDEKALTLGIGVELKNHGATPASEISHDFAMGPIQHPLPSDFVFPIPDVQLETNSTLFPNATLPVRFFYHRALSQAELGEVKTGKKRFHIWGTTHYRDIFNQPRTTRFSASFGGPDFATTMANQKKGHVGPDGRAKPGWFWEWGHGHNEAT